MTRAYVLINTGVGKAGGVVDALRELPGVTVADVVTGAYVVATLEGSDTNAIGRLVLQQIHGLAGLGATMTLVAVG